MLSPAHGAVTNMIFQASDGELTTADDLLVTIGQHINVPGDAATSLIALMISTPTS